MRNHRLNAHTNAGLTMLCAVLAVALLTAIFPANLLATPWWNSSWGYRVRIDVDANGYARYQRPVERALNFTTLFSSAGASGALNESSLRVIEVDAAGTVLDAAVVFQFDKDTDYNATTKASGTLVFLMGGTTTNGATRHFDVYFDNRAGFTAASFTPQVGISTVADWEGQESFRITSTRATYYYHKLGGGFASAIDADGNDWIGYHAPPTGYLGEWRGIPNMGSCAHPGYTNSTSAIAWQGPLKITILSQTNNGKQKWYSAVYPHNVTVTVARSDSNYWFLYEGVPGGALVGATQFMYLSTGDKTFLDTDWTGDIPGDEWAYFSDPATHRSLYMIHHEQDNIADTYRNGGGDGMTVFGFGREQTNDDWFLTAVPQTLSFGLMDATDFSVSSDTIHAIYKPMSISVGAAETGIPAVPVAPALLSPANSATGLTVPVLLRWNSSATATAYRVQVSTESGFTSGVIVDDSTLTDTTRSVSALGSKTTCFWRVAAKNAAGFGSFSSSRQFQTVLGTPTLLSPASGATGQAIPVTLRWNSVGNATSYGVQVSTEASFTTGIVLDDAAVADTTRSVSGLAVTTLYYWRVKAKDASSEGVYSGNRSFTTAIAAPTPVYPANHAVDIPLTTTLIWRAVPLALSYHVQVASDVNFSSGVVLDQSGITDTSRALSGLVKSTAYYWRVSAVGAGGEGPFSATNDFTTNLPAPQLLYPANGAVGIPLSPRLTWSPVAGAVHYWFQMATDSNFVSLVKNDTSIVDTGRVVAGLVSMTRYYWRVSVRTAAAISPFSSRWTFRAMAPVPETVVLSSPPNFQQVGPDSIRLVWRRTATASSKYWIDLSLDAGFTVIMTDSSVDTTKMVRNLLIDHGYWWRVRGGNGEAWGPYSETRQFVPKVGGTAVALEQGLPLEYGLKQNYPNPFNPSTTIAFALPHDGLVKLEVYNMLGGIVATLADGVFPAGNHTVRFDASQAASGMYFYRLTAGGQTFIRRMLLLK